MAFTASWVQGECQACSAVNALPLETMFPSLGGFAPEEVLGDEGALWRNGPDAGLSEAEHGALAPETQALPAPSDRTEHHSRSSGLVCRYQLYQLPKRIIGVPNLVIQWT